MNTKLLFVSFFYFTIFTARSAQCQRQPSETEVAASTEANISEEDTLFENFLQTVMENYTTWLSSRDPSDPVLEPIHLTDRYIGYGVYVDINITNQVMTNHTRIKREEVSKTLSRISEKRFVLGKSVTYEKYITFEGDYTAIGERLTDSGIRVPFHGQGKFIAKADLSLQDLYLNNYEIDRNGFINISKASIDQGFFITSGFSAESNFEGIALGEYEDDGEADEHVKVIVSRLSYLYDGILANTYAKDSVTPPKRLLLEYLTEIFSEYKITDIVPGWKPPPDPADSSSSFGRIVNHKVLSLMVLICALIFV